VALWQPQVTRPDPISLLFGGMEKLGPGDDVETLAVLAMLPSRPFHTVVDAGCGTGRQTIALAKALGVPIEALDSHEPFLADLARRADALGVAHLVRTHHMDMKDIPRAFRGIDLLWSEGAAYNIGFADALRTWAPAMETGGFAAVSELSWLVDPARAPGAAREFFQTAYPDMRTVEQNVSAVERAGFELLATHVLPRRSWVDGYYDVLEPRATSLLTHPDAAVREFAEDTIREIDVFRGNEHSYGYVFYVLRRP
jgi:cyclopropane fatty-acyl-phospholipid synthase-like methyltransferase